MHGHTDTRTADRLLHIAISGQIVREGGGTAFLSVLGGGRRFLVYTTAVGGRGGIFDQLILRKINKIVATRCQILML